MQKIENILNLVLRKQQQMHQQMRRSQPQMLQQWRGLQPLGAMKGLNLNFYC